MSPTDAESIPFSLPSVDDGNWLYARFDLLDGGADVGNFVFGQQFLPDVPEPSALVLMGVGIMVTAVFCRQSRPRPA
jgi:hypothetical protein